jgi:hypothetical protein
MLKHHALKMYTGSVGKTPSISTSVLDGVQWSASCSGLFTIGKKRVPRLDGYQRWLGHDREEKNPYPCHKSNLSHQVPKQSLTNLSWLI